MLSKFEFAAFAGTVTLARLMQFVGTAGADGVPAGVPVTTSR